MSRSSLSNVAGLVIAAALRVLSTAPISGFVPLAEPPPVHDGAGAMSVVMLSVPPDLTFAAAPAFVIPVTLTTARPPPEVAPGAWVNTVEVAEPIRALRT